MAEGIARRRRSIPNLFLEIDLGQHDIIIHRVNVLLQK